jgi:hypothetical protein
MFWNFSQSYCVVIGFEKWIGYSDVKSAPTYFYVHRNSSFSTTNVAIPFQIARLNIGGAFDLSSGIFTASRKGTYFFSFIGFPSVPVSSSNVRIVISFFLNGSKIGVGELSDSNHLTYQSGQVSIQSTLSLKVGDKIWVQIIDMAAGISLYDYPGFHYNHFSGWLLEEELSLP